MTSIYKSTVTEIGEMVPAFVAEGMLVFFGEGAPDELRDFCIMHEVIHKQDLMMVGDFVAIHDQEFEILAIGEVANENLMNLGHLNLKANGNTQADLPGDVCIAEVALPEISVGIEFGIRRG